MYQNHARLYFNPYKNLKSALQKNPPIEARNVSGVSKLLCGQKPVIVFANPRYLDFAASQCKIQIIKENVAASQVPDWFTGFIFSRKISSVFREKAKIAILKLYNVDSVEHWLLKKVFPSFSLKAAQDETRRLNSPASMHLLFPVFIFQYFSFMLGGIVFWFECTGPRVAFFNPDKPRVHQLAQLHRNS